VVSADVGSTVNVWDEQRGQMREVTDDDGLGSTVCVWEADTGKLFGRFNTVNITTSLSCLSYSLLMLQYAGRLTGLQNNSHVL
jgi:hypothetical protein